MEITGEEDFDNTEKMERGSSDRRLFVGLFDSSIVACFWRAAQIPVSELRISRCNFLFLSF